MHLKRRVVSALPKFYTYTPTTKIVMDGKGNKWY